MVDPFINLTYNVGRVELSLFCVSAPDTHPGVEHAQSKEDTCGQIGYPSRRRKVEVMVVSHSIVSFFRSEFGMGVGRQGKTDANSMRHSIAHHGGDEESRESTDGNATSETRT